MPFLAACGGGWHFITFRLAGIIRKDAELMSDMVKHSKYLSGYETMSYLAELRYHRIQLNNYCLCEVKMAAGMIVVASSLEVTFLDIVRV